MPEKIKEPAPPTEEPLTSGHQGSVATLELSSSGAAATESAVVYQVAVYTGDVPFAGTDGDVWIWFDGTLGRSGWRYLDNADDNFERNKTDYFYLNLPNLGTLTAAWIYFRPLGANSGWFLSTVVINGKTFSYYNWLERTGMVRLTSA